MQKTKAKIISNKIVSILLAAAMIATTTVASIGTVFAGGDTLPPREGEQGYKGENQPSYHGYHKQTLLDWTPEQDEYNEFMRAKVPLQKRNDAFKETQANPLLDQKVQVLSLAGDYGNEFFNPTIYNDQFSQNLFKFWQYEDIYASWHGTVNNPTPDDLFDPTAPWYERKYEFGIVNIPNPAYTNAAHKNGVMAIGCVFFPRSEHPTDWIYKDENGRFPLADKLVDLAEYYGFDGYFVNAEEEVPADFMPMYSEFMKAMTDEGMYVQVYASNYYGPGKDESEWGNINYYEKYASNFSNWIKEEGQDGINANSLYMNPGPSKEMVKDAVEHMASLGLDAKSTIFHTLEAGQTGFSGTRGSLNNLLDENLVPQTAIASLGNTTNWEHLDEHAFGHSGDNSYDENRRGNPDYQKYVEARERAWWTGSQNQPYYTNSNDYVVKGTTLFDKSTTEYTEAEREQLLEMILNAETNPYKTANDQTRAEYDGNSPVQGDFQSWPGMAAFASERSVINGTNFYTNFNTGHGMEFYVDGEVSNKNEWANINIQDILPTWQWWIEAKAPSMDNIDANEASKAVNEVTSPLDALIATPATAPTLKVDYDYGSKYSPAFELNQVGGFKGGSSLVVKGDLVSENFLHLYKTDMAINSNSKFNITYNKTSADDSSVMRLGMIFKDKPEEVVYVNINGTGSKTNGWETNEVNLSAYAGKQLAAFGLAFAPGEAAVSNYQMNIGEIKITDNSVAAPSAPTGLKIDKAFDTTELYISWDLADYSEVQQYNVYAEYANGERVYLGGTYDDVYYVKSLYNPNDDVKILVTAQGKDGVESEPAVVEVNYDNTISNITVDEQTGYFNVKWDNPSIDYASIKADVIFNYSHTLSYTQSFNKGTTSGTIKVPVADGSNYTIRLSLLDDSGSVISYVDKTGQLEDRYSAPYEGIATYSNGKVYVTGTVSLTLPTSYDWWHAYVTQNGKPLTVSGDDNFYYRGQDLSNLSVEDKSGTVQVVLEDFNGNFSEPVSIAYFENENATIDSSIFPDPAVLAKVKAQANSIEELENITSLDLSGTDVTDLYGLSMLTNLKTLNLSNCKNLTRIDSISGNIKLSELKINGCTNLQILDASGSGLEKIIYGKTSDLSKLVSMNVSNARLDLSNGTPEKALIDAVIAQSNNKADIVIKNRTTSNLAKNPIYYKSTGTKPGEYGDGKEDGDTNIANAFDGNKNTQMHIANFDNNGADYSKPTVLDFKLNTPITVDGYALTASESSRAFSEFEMYYSTDGVNYNLLGTKVTDNNEQIYEQQLSDKPTAQYFRLIGRKGVSKLNLYMVEIELFGYGSTVYKAGAVYDNQRPEAYVSYPYLVKAAVGSEAKDIRDVAVVKTINNNDFKALAGASFIDPDYNVAEAANDNSIMVDITGKYGNEYINTYSTAKNDMLNAKVISFNSSNPIGEVKADIMVKVGNGGNSPSTGGSSGGSGSTTAPDASAPIVTDKNNKTTVTVKDPATTIVGNKAEINVPTIDTTGATVAKPIEITVNVPSDKVVNLIKDTTGSQVLIDVVIPAALFNTANVSIKDINVDKDIFKQAKESGKQVVLNIKDTNGKSIAEWAFDGKNITNVLDTNLSLTVKNSNSLPSIAKTFGSNAKSAVVSFNHDGLLPGTASVKLDVSKNFANGDTLSLYYNNTATGKLEKVADGIIVDASGKATVKINHCSDYVLVKTASAANVPTVVAPSTNPQTGDNWFTGLFA